MRFGPRNNFIEANDISDDVFLTYYCRNFFRFCPVRWRRRNSQWLWFPLGCKPSTSQKYKHRDHRHAVAAWPQPTRRRHGRVHLPPTPLPWQQTARGGRVQAHGLGLLTENDSKSIEGDEDWGWVVWWNSDEAHMHAMNLGEANGCGRNGRRSTGRKKWTEGILWMKNRTSETFRKMMNFHGTFSQSKHNYQKNINVNTTPKNLSGALQLSSVRIFLSPQWRKTRFQFMQKNNK